MLFVARLALSLIESVVGNIDIVFNFQVYD